MFRTLPLSRINNSISPDWSLDDQAVFERCKQYGLNDLIEKSNHRWLSLLKDTLLDPMIWFLLVASILFGMLAEYSEAIILLLAIIPIGGMDAFLHWRTQVSTRALSSRLITFTRVIRDGKEKTIASQDIVPGDLIIVKAGDYFSADGIIVSAHNLQVDESSLTGESLPVMKQALQHLPKGQLEPLIEYHYWGFVGSRLLTGEAQIRVVYTGKETLYGEIIASVQQTHQDKTPLQRAIMHLVFVLIIVALVFCAILAVVRYYQGFGIVDALLSAATLAVAALPDEFPMVFTFFLSVGVYRLARTHALVRRAVSVENIGRVTCICTDKTGTLTEGRFHVAACLPANTITTMDLLSYAAFASRYESGDPLDNALLQFIQQDESMRPAYVRVYPFTEERKRETVIDKKDNQFIAVTKGAPEIILSISCLTREEQNDWRQRLMELAKQGYKVIACARYFLLTQNTFDEPQKNYQFLGFIAFEDPPRQEVFAAVHYCQKNNIRILMITGDHPTTAKKIASDMGLGNGAPHVMTATEAETTLKQHGYRFLRHVDVIARALPSQKLMIVSALRMMGDIVALTGDGVNDVPALREADVGIAMGERGTQSAREAASIILLDDNFGSIVHAISEGKQLFKNMQLSFKYLLMIHTPYVISAIIIPLLGFPLLYYPIHIVWIELFIHPTCMLVFQNLPEENRLPTMAQTSRKISFFTRLDWWGIAGLGVYTTSLVIITYLVSLNLTHEATVARANAFTAVGLTHIALTIGLSRLQSNTARFVVIASFLMLLFLVQIPIIAHYFDMQPPSLQVWILLSGLSLITLFLARKWS